MWRDGLQGEGVGEGKKGTEVCGGVLCEGRGWAGTWKWKCREKRKIRGWLRGEVEARVGVDVDGEVGDEAMFRGKGVRQGGREGGRWV